MKLKILIIALFCVAICAYLLITPFHTKAQTSIFFNKISLAPIANGNYKNPSTYINPPLGDVVLGGIPFYIPESGNNS